MRQPTDLSLARQSLVTSAAALVKSQAMEGRSGIQRGTGSARLASRTLGERRSWM